VDEKTAIQALDRLDPVLPLSPGRAERHGFEYYRHGNVIAVCGVEREDRKRGGKTAPRHTSAEFVAFLTQLLAKAKWAREVDILLDNLSAHKTQAVEQFLAGHPKVRLHFTPTYSSSRNQVEIWFAKIERDVIARGVFTSVSDLRRKANQVHSRLCQACSPHTLDLYRSQKANHR
jgi:transposase